MRSHEVQLPRSLPVSTGNNDNRLDGALHFVTFCDATAK